MLIIVLNYILLHNIHFKKLTFTSKAHFLNLTISKPIQNIIIKNSISVVTKSKTYVLKIHF